MYTKEFLFVLLGVVVQKQGDGIDYIEYRLKQPLEREQMYASLSLVIASYSIPVPRSV